MSAKSSRPLVLFASLGLAVAISVRLQAFDTQVSSSQGPTGYRGIVTANFYSTDNGEEIIGDFGTLGVWLYHHFGTWVRLTTDNPEWIFAVKFASPSDSELVGDFGTKGLWMWDYGPGYTGAWTQLSTANAEDGIAVDDDMDGNEELQVDFGSLGLWRYDYDDKTWTQLTTSNPVGPGLRTDQFEENWEEGLWSFGDAGLWVVFWDDGTYGGNVYFWQQLTASRPDDWAAANFVDPTGGHPAEELVADFGGLGTWLFTSSRVWTKLTDSAAQALVPAKFGDDTDAELLFADASFAPWVWWGGFNWERLSYTAMETGFMVAYDSDFLASGEPATEQEVAGDFGVQGLWEYNSIVPGVGTGLWRQLTTSNPVFMVAVDHWGDGKPGELVVNFGAGVGLWIWDSGAGAFYPNWTKMTDSVPDSTLSW